MNFRINTHIYPINIIVFLDEEDEIIKENLKYTDCNAMLNMSFYTTGRTELLDSLEIAIRLVSVPNRYDMLGNIHHEVQHAVFLLLDRIGCDYFPNTSNEAFTYLGEYIFKEICRKIGI